MWHALKGSAARGRLTISGFAELAARRRFATFGVPGLATPDDCARLARAAASSSDALAEAIVTAAARPSAASLQVLDEISSTLCGVLDPLELARNVHPQVGFRQAADAAYHELAACMAEYSTDERLYAAVRAVLDDKRVAASLSSEWLRFAHCMVHEFEHDGAGLPSSARNNLRALQAHEADLGQRFAAGATARNPHGGVWAPQWALVNLPAGLRAALHTRGELVLLPADRSLLTMALQHVHCATSRREIYECREALAPDNLEVLSELLQTRHAIARALGRQSYADYALSHDRMETCAEDVAAALTALSHALMPRTRSELETLARMRQTLIQTHCDGAAPAETNGGTADAVAPWDLAYLMEQSRASAYGTDAAELSSYLELEACLRGLQLVLSEGFGLSLQPVAAAEGELWHGSVRKLLLGTQANEGQPATPRGILYLDLTPRAGKTGHPALYTLRTGASLKSAGRADEHPLLMRHLPAAALVCDLPVSNGLGADPRSGKALLRPRQLETLYHEMGHAIHALLARTE